MATCVYVQYCIMGHGMLGIVGGTHLRPHLSTFVNVSITIDTMGPMG